MNCWEKTPQEVEEMLGTSIKKGLSSDVAEKRLQQQGKNTPKLLCSNKFYHQKLCWTL